MYVRSCNCQLYIRTFIYLAFTYVRTLNTTIRTKQMITIHYIQKVVYMTCYLTTDEKRLIIYYFMIYIIYNQLLKIYSNLVITKYRLFKVINLDRKSVV